MTAGARPRVAFVVQRYGAEVCGGAETHCRWICERLRPQWDVEVLTSTAIDHHGWRDHFPRGLGEVNGVPVRRFSSVQRERLTEPVPRELPGPYVPDLVRYCREHVDDYDLFVFFTYLYYPTAVGLPEVAHKAVMVPTAHDEPNLRYEHVYRRAFESARYFVFNTPEERAVVARHYAIAGTPHVFAALGVDPPRAAVEPARREAPYLVYVGRVEAAKGAGTLLRQFVHLKQRNPGPLELCLVGRVFPDVDVRALEGRGDVHLAGFVDDHERDRWIKGALALCNPSPYESLSIVLLEAWNLEVPVIVNARCEVLEAQCRRAQGGVPYRDFFELEAAVALLGADERLRRELATSGRRFVDERYRWPRVVEQYEQVAAAMRAAR